MSRNLREKNQTNKKSLKYYLYMGMFLEFLFQDVSKQYINSAFATIQQFFVMIKLCG